ncbi:MAG: hypothetical protein ACLFUJ_12205 [Phycisphaerae bacterium]
MDLLTARTIAEAEAWFLVRPCPGCGQGPWQLVRQSTPAPADPRLVMRAGCMQCDHQETVRFAVDQPDLPEEPWQVNPTDQPSELIDLAGWVGLFYGYLDQASRQTDKTRTRKLGYRAAVCLAEALKFYSDDDELPGEEAFFTRRGRRAYHEHTENFARQKLRDMQSRLPALDTMQDRLEQDQARRTRRRRWWQFWKS